MTFDEFWELPEKERAKAFPQLSERDRMGVRQQQISYSIESIPCNDCKFRFGITAACEAHPEGLTADHVRDAMKHCEYRETHR
ncbi:MAG: hypothetical protein E7238_00260 [Sarcina sp.]|nr:hypothetical protein [Sarcina sp.]